MKLAIDIRTLYIYKSRGLGSGLAVTLEGLHHDQSDNEYTLLVDSFHFKNETDDLVSSHPALGAIFSDTRFTIQQVPEFAMFVNSFNYTLEQLKLWYSFRLPPQTLYYSYNYFAPVLAHYPFAVHAPDTFIKDLPDFYTKEDRRLISWGEICIREAGLITTYTQHSKSDLQRHYGIPPEKIAVIHEAVSDKTFYPLSEIEKKAARRRYDLPDRYILCVGVVEPRKNFVNAIRAVKIYNQKHDDKLALVIAGATGLVRGESYHEVADEIERLDMKREVFMLGAIDPLKLMELYNCAEFLFFPSIYEGFGIPPVEAMLCGVPTVVANASSLPEVTDGASEYVDPNNPDFMAYGIGKVLRDARLRGKMVRRGFEVAKRYNLENRTRRLLSALYEYYNAIFMHPGARQKSKQSEKSQPAFKSM